MAVQAACAPASFVVDAHERARAYEIAAYLSAASFPFDRPDGPPAIPISNTDIALNALVQHGVHKMDCDRAFLSFIDNRSQFICAEMTRDQSILCPDPSRPLLLGTTRIPLEWGVCPYTMSIFQGKPVILPESPHIIADKSYFYIEDFRKVPAFAERPYVAGYPDMVSYIEIPLRSLDGYILGSYCVVDNKARDFLHPDAMRNIREITSAINQYLDLKRVEAGRLRAERMMDGLRHFIGSDRDVYSESTNIADPFSLSVYNLPSQKQINSNVQEGDSTPINRSTESTNQEKDDSNLQHHKDPPDNVYRSPERDLQPVLPDTTTFVKPGEDERVDTLKPSLFTQTGDLFTKAARTIGHAMDLDGLVFFDAVGSGTQSHYSLPTEPTENGPSQIPESEDNLCAKVLSDYHDDAADGKQLSHHPSQSLVQHLTVAYPHGHVFTVDEYGLLERGDSADEPTEDSINTPSTYEKWKSLFECIPKARYVIFLPQWHYQREASFSTCLAWVSDTGKTLDMSDVNSLTAFGNSLMAEVFRLEAATNTQQKSDFMSSISHELRSPLHGILATVELMQETMDDPHLLSMTRMIESCTYTLRDTFDHLLEYSRINSRKNDKRSQKPDYEENTDTTPAQQSVIDLSILMEDVVEAASLGHTSAAQLGSSLTTEQYDLITDEVSVSPPVPAIVTTYVEHGHDWNSHVQSGAWKRILLNVTSNALAYTESGHIDVSLSLLEKPDVGARYINLCISDTGVGMSPEFLKYHLFTPFMQENSLVPGTGLGLAIVKGIVESLDGSISVASSHHEGTRVTISMPFSPLTASVIQPNTSDGCSPHNALSGLTVGLVSIVLKAEPNSKSTAQVVSSPDLVRRCVHNICEKHLGMTVDDDVHIDALSKKDIILLDMHTISRTDRTELGELLPHIFPVIAARPVVILGCTRINKKESLDLDRATSIRSPITRQKLFDAFTTVLTKGKAADKTFIPVSDVQAQKAEPGFERESKEDVSSDKIAADTTSSYVTIPLRNDQRQNVLTTEANSPDILTSAQPTSSQQLDGAITNPRNLQIDCRFKRLLLVDDNPINLKVLVAFAQRIGRPFSIAQNGAEAVHLFKRSIEVEANPFDCVFMDISMPLMNGFQATAAIREYEKERRLQRQGQNGEQETPSLVHRCHIMALTGLGSDQARKTALGSGFDVFLMKPIKFKSLIPILGPLPDVRAR